MNYTPKIPKADLMHGAYYKGRCRNAEVARWNADKGCFIHWRTKFGQTFLEEIKHPEDEKHFDVFIVEERIYEVQDGKNVIYDGVGNTIKEIPL